MDISRYNCINLIYDAAFDVFISKGLHWVPVNILGKTNLDNDQMFDISKLSPENKRSNISTLFEAIQLLQCSSFEYTQSHHTIEVINGLSWTFNMPGYISVKYNCGCCTALAAWLNYFLEDKFQNRGYLMFVRPDGSCHIINYIHHNNSYYLIDPHAMITEKAVNCAKEYGRKVDYIKSKYATGIFFKADDLIDFVKFHNNIQKYHNFDFLYFTIHPYDAVPPYAIVERINGSLDFYIAGKTHCLHSPTNISYHSTNELCFSPNWTLRIDMALASSAKRPLL